ncbi:MAG: hypothetical protein GX247_01010 [Mollicutes bacterium]|nr:hypothetical protein [Mollicutes bacterium]
MEINKKGLESVINQTIKQNQLKKRKNNIYLSDYQVDVLNRYNIDYQKCSNINELLFLIESFLNNNTNDDCDDLEVVSQHLADQKYYYHTNK